MLQMKINDAITYLSISRINNSIKTELLGILKRAKNLDFKNLKSDISKVEGYLIKSTMDRDAKQDLLNLMTYYLNPILNIVNTKEVYNYGSNS